MRHFYAGTFINRDDLKNVGIEYPIKLEYYKTKPSIEATRDESKTRYGIEVVKTSYNHKDISTENVKIIEITEDEHTVNKILDTLKRNEVTPINAKYIVEDLLKEMV